MGSLFQNFEHVYRDPFRVYPCYLNFITLKVYVKYIGEYQQAQK